MGRPSRVSASNTALRWPNNRWRGPSSASLRPEEPRELGQVEAPTSRISRGLPSRTCSLPLFPGHRPAASDALGSALPARWAGPYSTTQV